MCALHLTLAPASVDVNVHPNKLEVRFRDEAATKLAVETMLRDALQGGAMLRLDAEPPATVNPVRSVVRLPLPSQSAVQPETEVANKETEVCKKQSKVSNKETDVSFSPQGTSAGSTLDALVSAERQRLGLGENAALRETPFSPPPAAPAPAQEPFAASAPAEAQAPVQTQIPLERPPYRVIGVLFKTYILLECEDSFLLIDQHAAHERLRYDALVKAVEDGVASQRLLTPQIVRVTAREMALVEEHMDALTAAGYDLSPIGERDLQIRAVPHILGRADAQPRFMDVIDALSGLGSAALEARRDEILQRACKGAVKAGDPLTDSEIEALLAQMEASGAPPTCPHGRPVIKTFSRREIERMFRRIQ